MQYFKRFSSLFLVALVLLSGCTIPAPVCQLDTLVYPQTKMLSGQPLQLGIIDASHVFPLDLPGPLRQSGATWAVLDDVRWGFIEPQAPQQGVHLYEWDNETAALDTRVQAYQQAGFQLIMVLRAWNPWARVAAPQGGQAAATASTPPQADYLDDYAAWVQALVERYDGDGVDDFPGLVDVDGDGQPDPVLHYQIEFEAVSGVWWQGTSAETTVSDYLSLLRTAATAARTANPQVKMIVAGIPALDLLDGEPTAASLEDVVTNIDPAVCGAIGAFAQILAATDAYDIISVHSMADYTGLATLARWVQTLAPSPAPPVWIMAATSAPALTADPQTLRVKPKFPVQGETLWASLQDFTAPEHNRVEAWYRGEQVRLAFKKWVLAAWAGFDGLIMGLEQDRPEYENAALGQRDLAFQGLLDPADGFTTPTTRPVIPALALAQSQLAGYTRVRKLAGLGANVQSYEFLIESLPVYVLWLDDGLERGPDDTPLTATVQLPVHASQFTTFMPATTREQSGPRIEALTAQDGYLNLSLSETPLIVRGDWAPLYWPLITSTAP
ncbi:MAG: hypothetical protein GXP38_06015 [Chloroflexi bacterium]|nr:hypothetical protein [Chloroflexota bacterium]